MPLLPGGTMLTTILFLAACISGISSVSAAELYPFGLNADDMTITDVDDFLIGPIKLPQPALFKFYQNNYTEFYISTDGQITFSPTILGFRPTTDRLDVPYIAPLWIDMVMTRGGKLHYRVTDEIALLATLSEDIAKIGGNLLLNYTQWAAIITWEDVASIGRLNQSKNTFQVVMTSDCVQSFVIFLYDNINWVQSWIADYAVAGFNAGLPYSGKMLLSGSGTDAISDIATRQNNHIGVAGKLVFRVEGHIILTKTCHPERFGSRCSLDARCLGGQAPYRIGCPQGFKGITKEECESHGCCFDSSFRRTYYCFVPLPICDVVIRQVNDPACIEAAKASYSRKDCVEGRGRANKARCMAFGCCWNRSVRKPRSRCFHPA